jgi:hypothetical protein
MLNKESHASQQIREAHERADASARFIDTGAKDTNPKDAVGSSKVAFHVIPWRVITGIAHAFLGGALKYRAYNYRIAGVRASVYVAASIRHILRFWEGEDWDPDVKGYNKESPLDGVLIHHLDEAIAGLMVIRDSIIRGNWQDDRPPASEPGWIDEANEMTARIIAANPDGLPSWTQAEVAKGKALAASLEAFDNKPAPERRIFDGGETASDVAQRHTFEVPEGMVAVRDGEGRATGELVPEVAERTGEDLRADMRALGALHHKRVYPRDAIDAG